MSACIDQGSDLDQRCSHLAYPFCLISFLLLWHLIANAVRVPERPNRELVEDSDLGKYVEIKEFVWLFIVSEWIRDLRRLCVVLPAGVLVKIVKSASAAKVSWVIPNGEQCTYVRPRCDDIHLRRHNPISSSFCEGSGLRHSASRSWDSEELVSANSTREVSETFIFNATKRISLISSQRYRCTYLDPKIFINLHHLPKNGNVLHKTSKIP